MTDLQTHIRDLLGRATHPVAVVVAPHALEDPQAVADTHRVEVREWAGCSGNRVYVRSAGEYPMGDVVATPNSPEGS